MSTHCLKTVRKNSVAFALHLLVAISGVGLTSSASSAPERGEAQNAAPTLLSTEGNKPKWAAIADLAAAAQQGDAEACFLYAQLHEEGSSSNGVAKDEAKALDLYQRAGEKGYAPALFRLGKIYGDGALSVAPDQAKSFGYFERAARHGSAEGKFNIGAMLVSGRGVTRNYIEGLAWLTLAAKAGTGSDAVQQVRQRLAKRPQDITRAEQRATELEAEISQSKKPMGADEAPKTK